MNYVYLIAGILLFAITVLDIIKTTFSTKGGGRITSVLARGVWSLFFKAGNKKGSSIILSYAGPVILISILLCWVAGLWGGLFLVLLSDYNAIINSKSMTNADALEKLYYAGFTLSTLGVGDYVASSNLWRMVTAVTAFSGLAFITASITYFVPVLQAVGLQSKLSLYISGMGQTPQQILANSWNGKNFSSYFETVPDVCQMLMQHIMNHHSYPVIYYFHNHQSKISITLGLVLLTETYHLLKHAVPQYEAEIDKLKMSMLQTSLDDYLDMVKNEFLKNIKPGEDAPMPDLRQLRAEGIPLQNDESIKTAFNQNAHKRRKLLTLLLEKNGWTWEDVYGKSSH